MQPQYQTKHSIASLHQFPVGYSEWEPPDSIPNSVVKTLSADDSVRSPHVKVGRRQDFNSKKALIERLRLFFDSRKINTKLIQNLLTRPINIRIYVIFY